MELTGPLTPSSPPMNPMDRLRKARAELSANLEVALRVLNGDDATPASVNQALVNIGLAQQKWNQAVMGVPLDIMTMAPPSVQAK